MDTKGGKWGGSGGGGVMNWEIGIDICDGILKSRGQTVQGQLKGMSAEAEIQL